MNIAIAADHAGFPLKELLKKFLEGEGHKVVDYGAKILNMEDDYPDFIAPAASAVSKGEVERAILLGGSGQGEAIVANRFPNVRAIVFYGGKKEIIALGREHNDSNALSLAARFLSFDEARVAVTAWLSANFSGDLRHVRRIKKIEEEGAIYA
ncbi:MAG: RpiB/LacA/LacB family sugar-phosphate isomerase [Patescibacteria group bacterium]